MATKMVVTILFVFVCHVAIAMGDDYSDPGPPPPDDYSDPGPPPPDDYTDSPPDAYNGSPPDDSSDSPPSDPYYYYYETPYNSGEPPPMSESDSAALEAVKAAVINKDSFPEISCGSYEFYCYADGRVYDIRFDNLELGGSIAAEIGNLSSLEFLDLSSNGFTGSIPPSIGNLASLIELNISSNSLKGPIPSSIGDLISLITLDLSFNLLSGAIPSSIDQMFSLQNLYLNNNLLIGYISFRLDSWANKPDFDFRNNFLSGSAIAYDVDPKICSSLGNNCFDNSHPLRKSCSRQQLKDRRRPILCLRFCNASQPLGACAGHGMCLGYNQRCSCDDGYSTSPNAPNACTFSPRGLGLTEPPENSYANQFFRYASTGFLYSMDKVPTWLVATSWNWIVQLPVKAAKDQMTCNSCFVFSAFTAIEQAYYIANGGGQPLPDFSPNQYFDCSSKVFNCSEGGWPSQAFGFAINEGLFFSNNFMGSGSCNTSPDLKILSFDRVKMNGWTGILLALQQQPAVVAIEASSDAFKNYNPALGVFSDESCFSNGVDHSVVVVGYDLLADTPYWLIQNSWGPNWGDGGFMRIKMSFGYGICGINTQPAIIPIIKPNPKDPCHFENFAKKQQNATIGPGNMNPCGNGICTETENGESYSCQCMPQFEAVMNTDGTKTCAPASPCTFSSSNPCGMGTCVDSSINPGYYACVCVMGYVPDQSEGPLTCVPAASQENITEFIVPINGSINCPDVVSTYGLSFKTLKKQTEGLNCSTTLPKDFKVNVTGARPCSLTYAANEGDTCESIKLMFNLTDDLAPPDNSMKSDVSEDPNSPPSSSDPDTYLNPGLTCSELKPFQQICIKREMPTFDGPCTLPYNVKRGETCATIICSRTSMTATKFYSLNPGIYCGALKDNSNDDSIFKQEVCLERLDLGSNLGGCKGKPYTIKRGESCSTLTYRFFRNSVTFVNMGNPPCTSSLLKKILAKKSAICVPKSAKI